MKKTRFISQDKQQQLFAAALRRNVNDYFKANNISNKGNGILVSQAVSMFALYLTPLILVLTLPIPIWAAVLLPVLAGIGLAGIGMNVMHGGAHEALSESKGVNAFFAFSMSLLGNSVFIWKIQHNMLHHTYTNISVLDRDIDNKGPLRLCEHMPLKRIHRYQHIYGLLTYVFLTLSMLTKDMIQLFDYRRMGIVKKQGVNFGRELTSMILIKIAHLAIFIGLPLIFTDYAWWQVCLAWLLMHMTGGFILSVVFQLAHVVQGVAQPMPSDEGVIENDWVVHEMQTTANFARKNRLLSWYIGGLNFQVEHHLFPHICHVHYPKIAPIVERTAKEYGVPYIDFPTFTGAFASHLRRLKELGNIAPVQSAWLLAKD